MQALAGCMAAWELWEHALVPSLLSGAGTWLGDIKKAVDLCDDTQNFFWRLILEVPESCVKVALRSETQSIGRKWRIWETNKELFGVRKKIAGKKMFIMSNLKQKSASKVFGLGSNPPFLGKCPNQSRKKVPWTIWIWVGPPPPLDNVQIKADFFLG